MGAFPRGERGCPVHTATCHPVATQPSLSGFSPSASLRLTSQGHQHLCSATPLAHLYSRTSPGLLGNSLSAARPCLPRPLASACSLLTTLRLVLCRLFHPHVVPQYPFLPSQSSDTRCPERPVKPVWDWMLRNEVVTGPQRHLWWRQVVTDITPPSSVGSEPLFKLQAKSSPKTRHFPSPFAATSQHAPVGTERGQQCPMQLVGGGTLLTLSSLPWLSSPGEGSMLQGW